MTTKEKKSAYQKAYWVRTRAAAAAKQLAYRQRPEVKAMYKETAVMYRAKPGNKVRQAVTAKEWNEDNSEQAAANRARNHTANRQRMVDYRAARSCLDCGSKVKLEFHHRVPRTKADFLIGRMCHSDWGKVSKEIAKCDLLCRNCHRARHREMRKTLVPAP